jgi:hypothetical protein
MVGWLAVFVATLLLPGGAVIMDLSPSTIGEFVAAHPLTVVEFVNRGGLSSEFRALLRSDRDGACHKCRVH